MSSRSESYILDQQRNYADSYDKYSRLSAVGKCASCAATVPLVEDMNATFIEVSTHLGNRVAELERERTQSNIDKAAKEAQKVIDKKVEAFRIGCADITSLLYTEIWSLVKQMYKDAKINMYKTAFFDDLKDGDDMAVLFKDQALAVLKISAKEYDDIVQNKDMRNSMYHADIATLQDAADYLAKNVPPTKFVHIANILKKFVNGNIGAN